jgi:hypothetical protein
VSKPFSPASERNRDVILDVLRAHFGDCRTVLEIGSGTGQHAVHFAAALPHLSWQTSDVPAHLDGIRQWLDEAHLPNAPGPLSFDINAAPPPGRFDAVFSANTLHIMGWHEVQWLFTMLPGLMRDGALLVVYGPFNEGGEFTSASNAAFDASLRAADARRGIRDLEAVDALAASAGLALIEDRPMPANNRCLVWRMPRGAHSPLDRTIVSQQ